MMQDHPPGGDVTLLLQDLLSPAATLLPASTPQLISFHLATLPLGPAPTLIPQLLHYILISPSLWKGQAARPSASLNWARALEVFSAVRDGVIHRAGEITAKLSSGWRARRQYGFFLAEYCAGVNAEDECHPVVRLLLLSAALAGLQAIKARKDKLFVGGSALIGRAENEVLDAWDSYFEVAGDSKIGAWQGPSRSELELRYDSIDILPSWLASQTLPMFSVTALSAGPVPALLSHLTESFCNVFAHGSLFSSLASDLARSSAGQLHWNIPSPSHTLLTTLTSSPLFNTLGPLSRAIGRTVEASTVTSLPSSTLALERLTSLIRRDWASTPWSDATSDDALSEPTRSTTLPWTILKSLIFSLTLIESSVLVVLSPEHTETPTPLARSLASQALRILGQTYFVNTKFGIEGLSAWKGVWSGLLEVLRHDATSVLDLMKALEPAENGRLHNREVERSVATFYLNTAEQLMARLPTKYVEETTLKCCRPYLMDPKYRDTFESAHSVVLAIFATEKDVANSLAPWYTDLLLKAYPDLMSTSQLRLAFTAMVRCVSNSDDALAWYCILQLIASIDSLPVSAPTLSDSTASSPLTLSREFDEATSTTRLDEASQLSPLELEALSLQRGHLLLTLIDQTSSVNLILLTKLLDKVWELVKVEQGRKGREALVKVVFNTLGQGLDATKREAGVRYWMERSQELERL